MYIAILASNFADRKHLERLSGRVNQTLSGTAGPLYADSFGDLASLLHTPQKYSAFFLDMPDDPILAVEVTEKLRILGVNGTMIITCHPDRLADYPQDIPNCLILSRPVTQDSLYKIVDDIFIQQQKQKIPSIEIRGELETHYLPVDSILYAVEENHLVNITTKEGLHYFMLGCLQEFYRMLDNYEDYLLVRKEIVVDRREVESQGLLRMTFKNGQTYQYKKRRFF